MMFYRATLWDLIRFTFSRHNAEQTPRPEIYHERMKRLEDENARLHAELAKALLELANVKRSVAAKMAPSLKEKVSA